MKRFIRHKNAKDLSENGRIILAWGEVTNHHHEVVAATETSPDVPAAQFFEEPDGRRVLLVTKPCGLRHQEHGPINLDPNNPVQARQGDVLLTPIGRGVWEVIRQSEYHPEAIRSVAD